MSENSILFSFKRIVFTNKLLLRAEKTILQYFSAVSPLKINLNIIYQIIKKNEQFLFFSAKISLLTLIRRINI